MPKVFHIASILTLAAGLTLTTPSYAGENAFWGTGVGAALGGLLGSQFGQGDGQLAATGLGVFMGGLMGNEVGHSLDRGNAAYYGRSSYYTPAPYYGQTTAYVPTYVAPPAPPPRRVVYVQPEVVEYRDYAPAPVYVQQGYAGRGNSRYCREFTQQVRVGNRIQESYGTACMQPDGSWEIER